MTHKRGDQERTPEVPEVDQLLLNGRLKNGQRKGEREERKEGGRKKGEKEIRAGWREEGKTGERKTERKRGRKEKVKDIN